MQNGFIQERINDSPAAKKHLYPVFLGLLHLRFSPNRVNTTALHNSLYKLPKQKDK
ncbi:Uncharacterized protein APZ42_031680 [Daphnia magna]|uniref:Uncharacterized protein n=1 Tax=Daphnia magna TaxID=35525 RepID=A0A164MJ96_9CRUS|nr:Uncharacterized protein APZ42_031680 [Daphnia magna]